MALVTFSPNTVIKSADVNSNFSGLANWSLLSGSSAVITNFIQPGTGLLAISSGLVGTFSNIVYFIAGQYYTLTSIANKTYTASKDTYVDVSTVGVTYTEVATNAASPALSANNIRVGIAVSAASLTSFNQGAPTAVTPIASTVPYAVTDSLGNLIYPTSPNPVLIGYRQDISTRTQAVATVTAYTLLSVPVIVPGNRKVKITVELPQYSITPADGGPRVAVWDGTVGSGTELQRVGATSTTANTCVLEIIIQPAAASKTYNVGWYTGNVGVTATSTAAATSPAFISVELM